MKKNGFTFVEMVVAVIIGAFVTVTAAAAMRGIVAGRQTHQRLTEVSDEIRYACGLVRDDLNNLYRAGEFRNARFELSYLDGDDGLSVPSLTFYTVSRKKARALQPEGDVYEVQYFVKGNPDTGHSVLMRRYCPVVPGVAAEDNAAEGILAPIAEHVMSMTVRCYNGTEWTDEWNEKNGRYPQLVEVVFCAGRNDDKKKFIRLIFINIPRLKSDTDDADPQDLTESQDGEDDYASYMSADFSGTPDTEAER